MPLANSGGTAGRRHRPGLRPRQIVRLSTGSAQAVQAAGTDSPATVLARLGVQRPIATLVLIGGTDDLDADLARRLQRLLGGVAAATVDDKVTIVSGGTAAGVLALFGSGLEDRKLTAPVIGIVPAGKVDLNPSAHRVEDDKAVLEPHHTHFVLVDGNHWGDETPMLLGIVRELARQSPAVVLLASGGDIARQELEGLLAARVGHLTWSTLTLRQESCGVALMTSWPRDRVRNRGLSAGHSAAAPKSLVAATETPAHR